MPAPRPLNMPRWLPLVTVTALLACGCNMMNGRVSNTQGMAHYRSGNYTAARWEFQRAMVDDPGNPDYAHNLAMAMQKQGDAAGSEQMYRRALFIDPSHQPSYHALATQLRGQGRQQEAVAMLQGWSATQPYSAPAQIEMAWAQRETGDYAGSEQSLRQALRVAPNHPTALAHLGQVYQDTGRNREAVAYYQRSLSSNYNQPQLHSRLAAMRPVSAYRAQERMAAGQPVYGYGAPSMAYNPYSPAPPTFATQTWGTPTYAMSPTPTFAQGFSPTPIMSAQQPAQLGPPLIGNADPAHVHSPSTAEAPPVQPY